MAKADLQVLVNQLPWHHQIDFGDGVTSPGRGEIGSLRAAADVYFKHGIAGKSFLDIVAGMASTASRQVAGAHPEF
jgi:tRNA (mo5U34)-methyltransferase